MNNGNGKPKTVRELYYYLEGKFSTFEKCASSVQTELTEHKKNHWKVNSLIVGLTAIITSIIIFLVGLIK